MTKTIKYVTVSIFVVLGLFAIFYFMFLRECSSYSGPNETVPETRCKCVGKVVSLDRWFGNEDKLRGGGAFYDRCLGIRTSRYSL